MNRLHSNAPFVRRVLRKGTSVQTRRNLITKASKGEICALCEVVKNVVHNPSLQLKVSTRQRQLLKKKKKALKSLISRRVPLESKRKLLLHGKGLPALVPLIASVAGPLISSIIDRFRS